MFCPDCGQAEQVAGKYCRGCGKYLPVQSIWSERKYSPRSTVGWIAAGLALALLMMLAGGWALLKPDYQLLGRALLGGAFGSLLSNLWIALRLYLRMGCARAAAELERPAAPALNAADAAQAVNVATVTEATTALLEKVRDTQRS